MANRVNQALAALLMCAGVVWAASANSCKQAKPTPARPTKSIQLRGVSIDRAKGEISFAVKVSKPEYLLEYFLCGGDGKAYESAFMTDALGQDIHAGLLLLGLGAGHPARRIDGEDIPPRGAELDLILEWTAAEESRKQMNVMELLGVKGGSRPKYWVFVGSSVSTRGRYGADADGGLISVCNLPTAVIDLPVESSRAMDGRIFSIDAKKLPKAPKNLRMVIRPRPEAKKCPYGRATLDIAADGAMRIDGRPIVMADLEAWASKFTDRYRKALIEIRSNARTLSALPLLAQLELKLGGVFDVDKSVLPPAGLILPRTMAETASRLKAYTQKFAEPEEELRPPAVQVREEIANIDRRLKELEELRKVWTAYRASLKAMVDRSTEPAPATKDAK